MWKKGRAEIPLGEAPKEREMPKKGERACTELSDEEKEREPHKHSFLWPDHSLPHQSPLHFIPKPGEHKQRDEKVEFLFTLADRNLNLPSPLRTKNLKPLMS